ncbi:MAG TPA: DUF1385 domain-containing protein [Acidimicrobiia bacterium]|nr:DUF1385 domain-containing protein [Acidimicrobiia bacterium]
MSKQPAPRYMGGQAVMEGVMMRGASSWAVAVRTPDGSIEVDVNDAPNWAERYSHIPFVRGITTLGESLSLGFKALAWSANLQVPEEERLSSRAMGWTVATALTIFSAIFLVLPALAVRGIGGWIGATGIWSHVAEGALRLTLFIGYILAIGQLKDIKRVFQYHGAEHKAIAAYENEVELSPESAQQFSTEHVRCGTNFLLTVMLVAIVVYSAFGRPALPLLILSRVVLIPVIAGVSYEIIRFAAGHMQWGWVRACMKPGLMLQRLTTRPPSLDQLEVAIASLRAVMTPEQLAAVESRVGLRRSMPVPKTALGIA